MLQYVLISVLNQKSVVNQADSLIKKISPVTLICHSQVNFTVTLTSSTCLEKTESFTIKVQGINEELKVTVETLCDCNCLDSEAQSSLCNTNGTFHCGICR